MRKGIALTGTLLLVLAACGDDDDEATGSTTGSSGAAATTAAAGTTLAPASTAAPSTTAPVGAYPVPTTTAAPGTTAALGTTVAAGPCPGTVGCVPANQPDVNGSGVVVGVLSPGDTNDNGYYESLVSAARDYSDGEGWQLVVVDRVNPVDAVEQTRNLCRQGVDFLAVADLQLQDALPVAGEPVCEGVIFYLVTGGNEAKLNGNFFVTGEDVNESQVTTGYATGLVMRDLDVTKAGFIGGPELAFVNDSYRAWGNGIRLVLPDATFVQTLTGSFDDSALGQEAAQAQISEGAGIIYPYLGGAIGAAASAAAQSDVLSIAPGTDRCAEPQFAVSSLFPPGDYFRASLERLKAGEIKMGERIIFRVGVDDVVGATICPSVPNADALNAELDQFMADVAAGDVDTDQVASGEL
jgi:basic membrane protein A